MSTHPNVPALVGVASVFVVLYGLHHLGGEDAGSHSAKPTIQASSTAQVPAAPTNPLCLIYEQSRLKEKELSKKEAAAPNSLARDEIKSWDAQKAIYADFRQQANQEITLNGAEFNLRNVDRKSDGYLEHGGILLKLHIPTDDCYVEAEALVHDVASASSFLKTIQSDVKVRIRGRVDPDTNRGYGLDLFVTQMTANGTTIQLNPVIPTEAEKAADKREGDTYTTCKALQMIGIDKGENCATTARMERFSQPMQTTAAPQPQRSHPEPSTSAISDDYRKTLSAWLESHKRYPEAARQRSEEGSAVLRFRVDRSGYIRDYKVVRSTGFADLDQSIETMMRAGTMPPFPSSMTMPEIEASVTINFGLTR